MKIKVFLLSFILLVSGVSIAWAQQSEPTVAALGEVAMESTQVAGSRVTPILVRAMEKHLGKAMNAVTGTNPSERLGRDLARVFQESAVKLDAPRPKRVEQSTGEGVPVGGRTLSVTAYSYCLNGRTASGRSTAPGIVAVDTRVIPMGSKLYIPGYGWGVAADTGGAIVGNKIDVWFPSLGQCYQWGVRPVTIKVFPKS